jgi:hypothetical protein
MNKVYFGKLNCPRVKYLAAIDSTSTIKTNTSEPPQASAFHLSSAAMAKLKIVTGKLAMG